MKSKEVKYKEAVERNLKSAGTFKLRKYQGKPCSEIKRAIGIRRGDHQFDNHPSWSLLCDYKSKPNNVPQLHE